MLFSYILQVELLVSRLNIKEAYMFGGAIVDAMLGLPVTKNKDVDIAIVGGEKDCKEIRQMIQSLSVVCSEVKFTILNSLGGVWGFWFYYNGCKYDVCFIQNKNQLGVFDIDSVIVSFPDKTVTGLDKAFNELLAGELYPKRSLNEVGPLRYAVRYIKMYVKYNVIPNDELPELYYSECHKDYSHFFHYLVINLKDMRNKPLAQNLSFLRRVVEPIDSLIYKLCVRYFTRKKDSQGCVLSDLMALSSHSERVGLNARVNLLKERNDFGFYYA